MHKLGLRPHCTRTPSTPTHSHKSSRIRANKSKSRVCSPACRIAARFHRPGYRHLLTMQACFQLTGSSGVHSCLVFEMLGPSVLNLDSRGCDGGLWENVARMVAEQALLGLEHLTGQGIGNGGKIGLSRLLELLGWLLLGLRTRNLAFAVTSLQAVQEEEFSRKLVTFETYPVEVSMDKRRVWMYHDAFLGRMLIRLMLALPLTQSRSSTSVSRS